ncbi:hypothetical protein [Bacteroides faecalis]|uniref:Lanthionine synthetase C-like protein n=1 Tax=Bacteroides faecalis TaxID=2447885 RepID=A0A401LW60_9BACE|nr:hypothetical protein [Bacteroides faecalis]GCB35776.1 hypothetical protein KGMB02408_27210 [Bacteroides faecalis]
MNKILLQTANAIVANLANTEQVGLFDGKIGVCLFLYRYAQYSGNGIYENIASNLLDGIFGQLKPDLSPSAIDGGFGIGLGLTNLIKDGFLEVDPRESVFHYVDEALFRDVRSPLMKEINFPIPLFSSGMYLLSRMSWRMDDIDNVWIAGMIENSRSIIASGINNKRKLKLSLLNSMLYVLCGFYERLEVNKIGIRKLLNDILNLCIQSIDEGEYQDIDIILLKQLVEKNQVNLKVISVSVLEKIDCLDCFVDMDTLDVWYDNAWWGILYNIPILRKLSFENVKIYIDKKIQDSFYDISMINSKLSSVGLWLMSK